MISRVNTPASAKALLERLSLDRPLESVELRPPRSDLSHADSIDTWIDMHHAIKRLASQDTVVFLTDNAIGMEEEENLHHLSTNLGEVDPGKLVPFLTAKHTLDYCLMYATRAYSAGYEALVVLGGDKQVGTPRCLPHAFELREKIRERHPGLVLGGWANPHADPVKQVDYLLDPRFAAEFVLTQVVSHHDLHQVEAFVNEARRREVQLPIVFGTFYYRSAKPKTLQALGEFMPVPAEGLKADFAAGHTASQICAKTIQGLRDLGVDKVYVSNLGHGRARKRLKLIRGHLTPG